jgi:hypothetical protein
MIPSPRIVYNSTHPMTVGMRGSVRAQSTSDGAICRPDDVIAGQVRVVCAGSYAPGALRPFVAEQHQARFRVADPFGRATSEEDVVTIDVRNSAPRVVVSAVAPEVSCTTTCNRIASCDGAIACVETRVAHAGWSGSYSVQCSDPDGDPVWFDGGGTSTRCDAALLRFPVEVGPEERVVATGCPKPCSGGTCPAPPRLSPSTWTTTLSRPHDDDRDAVDNTNRVGVVVSIVPTCR